VSDRPAERLAKGNKIPGGSRAKGPYRSYAVDLAADPYTVQLTKAPDGNYHGYFQFLTYVYDQDGRLVNTVDNVERADFAEPMYARVMANGLPFRQEVSVPMKGEYYLRVGLRDLSSNHVGSVECRWRM